MTDKPTETTTETTTEPTTPEKEVVVIPTPHSTKSTADTVRERIAAESATVKEAAIKAAEDAAAAATAKAKELAGDEPADETVEDPETPVEEAEEAPTEEAELDTDAFGDTGSEVGNSVLTLLQNAGATPEDARALLFDAVQSNDMTKIDTAALEALVGKANATIILTGAKTYASEVANQSAAIAKEVNAAVGGEDNWSAVQTWSDSSTSITDAEKGEYNDLLQAGGAKARFAATELLSRYNADKGNSEITDTTRVDADVDTSSQSKATTAKEYYEQMVDANRKGQDTTAIKAARARGRKQGI